MGATLIGVSIDDFLAGDFPAGSWLVEGEVVMTDPTFEHQRIAGLIFAALLRWTREQPGRGTAGFGGNWSIAPGTVYKPDVWWAAEGFAPQGVRSDQPPQLAVEVRSPGTWALDVGIKRTRYEEAGVRELWLVDTPARMVMVHRRSSHTATAFDVALDIAEPVALISPMLDQFTLDLTELFG